MFIDIAKPLIERGIPVIRLRPKSKIAFDSDWPNLATTNFEIIEKWNQEMPDANCGCVALPGGICVFEVDDPNIQYKIREETGQTLPDTYIVRSSIGRGHFYFSSKNTPVENMSADLDGKELWSFRANAQYVVSEKSVHPKTGEPYEARSTAPIIEVPSWLIDWMKSQKNEKKIVEKEKEVFSEGSRNKSLASLAGKLRHAGLSADELQAALLTANLTRCIPPLSDDEVKVIAHSIARYEPAVESEILYGGKPVTAYGVEPAKLTVEEDLPEIQAVPYPIFPRWIFDSTSLYTGLVKPFCDINSRYPEFMFLPAMIILLNYLGTKVFIKEMESIPLSLFTVLIGRKGRVIKSTCIQDAIRYFEYMGIAAHGDQTIRNAEGRTLVFSPGSPEGLGRELNRTSCKNAVILYDELSALTNKANIENSNLTTNLLTLYESNKFANTIKSSKEGYSLLPGSYCCSLIAASTDKNFQTHWSKLSGKSSGLDDRFFFLIQPEKLEELTEFRQAYTQPGSIITRQLIDKAVKKGSYNISNRSPFRDFLQGNDEGNRSYIRAVKFSLGFAVDLGLDEIDLDCIERGLALAKYESQVKKYLKNYEASTREGQVQQEIMHFLINNGGSYPVREMERKLHASRHGTSLWNNALDGLKKHSWVRVLGNGTKGSPLVIQALRLLDDDD